MMNLFKKCFAILPAMVLCLSLTACVNNEPDVGGTDWRTTGIWRSDGTITRNGEDTDVLVCIHKADANFYYDTEEQVLFDSVDYPITLESDAWEAFQSIHFDDLNDDGNSDVTMNFNDGGTEILMVWFWDTENERFMYQPDESWLGEEEGLGDLIPDEADTVPVLMGGALPFTNMDTLQCENYEDGTYYYADMTEDGQIIVVNTVMQSNWVEDDQSLEEYFSDCALTLGDATTYDMLTIEENEAYSENMSYPVYIVTYTAGENEDTREWVVFVMDTDRYTYIYGFAFCATFSAEDDKEFIYQDIFAGLHLSDEE